MNVDYFDLFYSHRFDPDTPLDETLGALNSAVEQGKALYVYKKYSADYMGKAVNVCKENNFAPLLSINQIIPCLIDGWKMDC